MRKPTTNAPTARQTPKREEKQKTALHTPPVQSHYGALWVGPSASILGGPAAAHGIRYPKVIHSGYTVVRRRTADRAFNHIAAQAMVRRVVRAESEVVVTWFYWASLIKGCWTTEAEGLSLAFRH